MARNAERKARKEVQQEFQKEQEVA
jgi:hypothetical protein